MKNFIYIVLCMVHCIAFSQQSTSKKYTILKSTITTVGSSSIYLKKNNSTILQSIGQSGIIGSKKINSFSVQQGFLNNSIYFNINNYSKSSINKTLHFTISPNPFIDYIKIDFAQEPSKDIYIKIYDVNGKTHFTKKFNPTKNIRIPMIGYSIGSYLIRILSNEKSGAKKIIKVQ